MLRLDLVHPVISGNKIFKLRYFLEEALATGPRKIVTFGGAYSNHLAATAYACRQLQLSCVGFVRGERPATLSPTLQSCLDEGMQLEFTDRQVYRQLAGGKHPRVLAEQFGPHILVPEGGCSPMGMAGAATIWKLIGPDAYSHICCAIGTATTFAGLVGSSPGAAIVGIPVLKGMKDVPQRLAALGVTANTPHALVDGYHFGGYAKKDTILLEFMNGFYDRHGIPLDFVYTGKMMFGVLDLVRKDYFPRGARVCCIHSGGLQGNCSLAPGELRFPGSAGGIAATPS